MQLRLHRVEVILLLWKLIRWKETVLIWLAWRMPRRLALWCAIRVATYQYSGSPDNRTVSQMLKAWDVQTKGSG